MIDKVQKIRKELERLKEETSIGLSEHENGVEQGRMEIINALSLFLDSLQEEQFDKDEEILILKDQIESLHAARMAIKETHRIELEKQAGYVQGGYSKQYVLDLASRVESLKDRVQPQSYWQPSEEMLEALYRAVPQNVKEMSEDEILLDKLYQALKYGIVLK